MIETFSILFGAVLLLVSVWVSMLAIDADDWFERAAFGMIAVLFALMSLALIATDIGVYFGMEPFTP